MLKFFESQCIILITTVFLCVPVYCEAQQQPPPITSESSPIKSPERLDCTSSAISMPAPRKVIVEVPPPKIIFAQGQSSKSTENMIQQACHFCKNPHHIQTTTPIVGTQSITTMQPMALHFSPVAPQVLSLPPTYSQSLFLQPAYNQGLTLQPAINQGLTFQSGFSQGLSLTPVLNQGLNFSPFMGQSLNLPANPSVQSYSLQIVPSNPAQSIKAEDATTKSGSMDTNEALRKLSGQIDSLTKVLDKTADMLINHEIRLKALETKVFKTSADEVLPGPKPTGDLPPKK